jgi:HAD-superfamily subfamily IB hydrolase, TIGR01490
VNLALFDFDGTITFGDTWTPFMRLAVKPARQIVGRFLLAPAYAKYKYGMMPVGAMRESAIRVGLNGERVANVHALGCRYARETLPAVVRPCAAERLAWHTSRGDHVVVVSASLNVYLSPWCHDQQIATICTTLEERDGILTGKCVGGDCSGDEKVRRVLAQFSLSQYEAVYAYGDTPDDQPLLALATHKYYRWRDVS